VSRASRYPRSSKKFVAPEIMISHRPVEAADRTLPGHWEGDLFIAWTAPRSASSWSAPLDSRRCCTCLPCTATAPVTDPRTAAARRAQRRCDPNDAIVLDDLGRIQVAESFGPATATTYV
jgi:IS30 family transposase